jgi:hypothetical protein
MTANPVAPLPGNKFYVLVGDGASPTEAFNFLCVATTIDSDHSLDLEDAMVLDCSDPTLIAARASTPKGHTWDLKLSGVCDPAKAPYQRLLTAHRTAVVVNCQLMKNLPGASNGNIEQAGFFVSKLTESKADNGLVKFSAELHGQGLPTLTANA